MYLTTDTNAYKNFYDRRNCIVKESHQEIAILERLKLLHSDSYGWSLACCSWETSLAEDILQEAYLRTLDGRARFSEKSSLKTWFFAVIKNVANDIYRTQKRHSSLNLKLVTEELITTGIKTEHINDNPLSESIEAEESSMQLQYALKQLPQRQKEVLHLAFYAEFTLEEVSQTLNINLGSVRTHYHRGKIKLAQLLELDVI